MEKKIKNGKKRDRGKKPRKIATISNLSKSLYGDRQNLVIGRVILSVNLYFALIQNLTLQTT